MAVVLDSLGATATRTVFLKPPDMVRELTPVPRALVNFDVLNGVISAKPLNDTAELTIGITLSGSFAYRWVEVMASMVQDTARDWNGLCYLELTNAVRNLEAGMTMRHTALRSNGTRTPTPTEMWILTGTTDIPKYVIQAVSQVATPVITFKANNDTAAASAAGTVNFHAAFLEYDIEQAERFPIHYPVLTLDR